MRLRRLIALTLVTVLTASGCAAGQQDNTERNDDGEITEGGEVGAFKLQVGDCLNGTTTGLVDSLDGVPCSEEHEVEVYALFDLADGDFPGETNVGTQADLGCYDRFEPYVGLDFESSIYGVQQLVPTEDSWAAGDREVVCLINAFDGSILTGTAKDSAR